jgi:hypothetical protein
MAKAKVKPMDTLDQFAAEALADPRRAVEMLVWKQRFDQAPDLAVLVTEKDIIGFRQCCEYLDLEPEVRIVRPQGRPASQAIPAQGNRRAVPASAGEPPRPFVVVSLVKKGTADGFKPIENNEEDAKLRDQANALRRIRDNAPGIAADLMAGLSRKEYSEATIREAAAALTALARR